MLKFSLSCLIAALLGVFHVSIYFRDVDPASFNHDKERRRISQFPQLPLRIDEPELLQFFKGFTEYLTDRIPFRSGLIGLSTAVHQAAGDTPNTGDAYLGRDGWIFLGNRHSLYVDQLQGMTSVTGANLERQATGYRKLHAAARIEGAEFYVMIGPSRSTVYPEYLPPYLVPSKTRAITPLADALKAAGITVCDPTEQFLASKSDPGRLLYSRTDTHWNLYAGYLAFEIFRQAAGLPPLPPFTLEAEPPTYGQLLDFIGYGSFPLAPGDSFKLKWETPPKAYDPEKGEPRYMEPTSDKTVWVFGDSYANALRPYLMATFKDYVIIPRGIYYDVMLKVDQKPDIILWEIIERDFAVPDDTKGAAFNIVL